jgi:predicted DNA-binding protein (MmcQ/YjbR family)
MSLPGEELVATTRSGPFAERVRAAALALPESYEDAPWGHPVFKVRPNRLFALMREGPPFEVTVKMADAERPLALELPHVRLASHVGRYGWITTTVTDEATLELALDWLAESWWLRAPARVRRLVDLPR